MKKIILLSISIIYSLSCMAQLTHTSEFVKINLPLNTPVLDRMIRVDIARPHKFYTINCRCLNSGSKPVFRTNINNGTSISSREIAKIKFISLANLIELVPGEKRTENYILKLNTVSLSKLTDLAKKITDLTAHTLYIFYLVEKNTNSEYSIHKTRLLTPRKPQVSIDYEDIPNKEK